jgi:uncharacterized membrane protein YcaP (DUF421 family)
VETLGGTAFHTIAGMSALLVIWLIMGNRQIGELSPFDFAVSITAGTVVGAGIADPRIELSRTIVALGILAIMQVSLSWLAIKYRTVHQKVNYEPIVMVENGEIIKTNLRKARMPVEMLLQLLRDKDVFDITEVELAILEPHGKLSVLKKAEYRPIKANDLKVSVAPNRILIPVILEGQLQEEVLKKMGFSPEEIDRFRQSHQDKLDEVFIAFMDQNHRVHVTNEDVQENGMFLH